MKKVFSAVELILILVIVGVIGFVGWFVYHTKKTTDKNLAPATTTHQQALTAVDKTTPQGVTSLIISAVAKNNETGLETYLHPDFKTFRTTNLVPDTCHGGDASNISMYCSSLLNTAVASQVAKLKPEVADITFNDGKPGKSVVYEQLNQENGGVTIYAFGMIASGKTWQLYDYQDVFVAQGTTPPDNLGIRGE